MYKKSHSFVYKLWSISSFYKKLHQGVLYKAKNWHAFSHEQYFPKLDFLDFCHCALKSLSCSKAFGIGFRFEITSNEHIKHILSKVNKSIGLLRKFQPVVPRSSLLTIYKIFICSHFDYTNVVYDQSYKSSFHKKLELIQYNAALAVTGAI